MNTAIQQTVHKIIAASATKGANGTNMFTISTGEVDRDGDRIDPHGWDLSAYRQNPVVLYGHAHSDLPIGRCPDIRVSGGKLKGTIEWPPPGCYPFADQVKGLVDAGFLRSASVGFRADASEPNAFGGHDIKAATLLEWSVVNIPSNMGAQLERGVDRMTLKSWLGGAGPRTDKEDEMYLELSDETDADLDRKVHGVCAHLAALLEGEIEMKEPDHFAEMLAQMREMSSDQFHMLMTAQFIAHPEFAAAMVRALQSAGAYEPKSWWVDIDDGPTFDVDEKHLALTIARVVAEEVGVQTRDAFNTALGRLD